jgi:hypothetical protein
MLVTKNIEWQMTVRNELEKNVEENGFRIS